MEENKNLNPEMEPETQEVKTEEESQEIKKPNKVKKTRKAKKPAKLKNQAAFKKGGYSLAITAAVIVGVIIINILVSALSSRFVLEFDMSKNKDNSMTKENIEYLQDIKEDINITVCANAENYSNYMGYYAQEYNVSDNAAVDYYDQTIRILKKYGDYNNKIEVDFIDPQTAEFTNITSKYMNETLAYGDVIVSAGDKHKIVGYKDIYSLYEDTTYASYGMSFYTVSGNNVETAVTSAISYVLAEDIKKVALLTGHSSVDYTATYLKMLKENNYEATVIEDKLVGEISKEYDAVIIVCPSKDFTAGELDAISEFLDNDGKLGKGLMVFADASAPYLPDLYDFLSQWGIVLEDGVVFETNASNHLESDPTTIGTYSTERDDLLSGISICLTGNNVPIYPAFENKNGISVLPLTTTPETSVAAPKGSGDGWAGADKLTPKEYNSSVLATKSDYDDDNNPIASCVAVFSSAHFLESEYSESGSVSNKNLVMAVTERATGADDSGIVFVSKYLESESFASDITEQDGKLMRNIFMWIIPLLTIAVAIFIYIRRKNA